LVWLLVAVPSQAYQIDSFFDIFLESSQGPPYPPPTAVTANVGTSALPFMPIEKFALRVKSVTPLSPTRMVGSDSGGGIGDPGINSFFDVFLDAETMMISSFFDIFTEVSTAGGLPLPLTNAPSVVWHADSFFDVFWEVDVPGQERQFVKMSFRVPDGQAVRFNTNAPPPSHNAPDSFFDVFLEVIPPPGGFINPNLPLFRVVMNARFGWPQPWPMPGNVVKFRQNPDPTIRGMDVLNSWLTNTGPATLLADDFICTRTGPVTDIHVWGSWKDDLVDYWPTFWVGIWSDMPASNNVPSQPGQLLWWQQFSPGQYRASVQQKVPFEQFLNPNAPPAIIGVDHQIWKYDFFPQNPFRQLGSAQLPKVYWLSVVTKTAPGRVFGWKTTPDHYNDFAVYAPTILTFGPGYPMPQPPGWQVITDPQGRKRELSFMLTTSQGWACNKDFWIPWYYPYGNARVILPSRWGISGNFNGFGGTSGQFDTFAWDWDTSGNTLMDWYGGAIAGGQWVHIGFEGPGVFPPFLNWGWWNPFGMHWWGWIPQVSIGWQPILQPIPRIGLTNILPIVPGLTNNVFISNLSVEYYTNSLELTQLSHSGVRNPIRVDSGFSIPNRMLAPQADIQVDIPLPPPEATHAVVIPQVSPVSEQGQPNPLEASTDWAMVPLTAATPDPTPPAPLLQTPVVAGSELTLTWSAVPGGIYRVQQRPQVEGSSWEDVEGDVIAGEATASKTLTLGGDAGFYRVMGFAP
jgi:hypothetical protein